MADLGSILNVAFYSGFVCCGIAVLRGTAFSAMSTVYIGAYLCAGVFYRVNSLSLPFTAGFLATCASCIPVRFFHHQNKHSYLFIVIACIYCITPGAALYKMFYRRFCADWRRFSAQFIYTAKVAVGCFLAVKFSTKIGDIICKKQADALPAHENTAEKV